MSFAFARSRYRQADSVVQPVADDPYDVVFVTLKALSRALEILAAAQGQGRSAPTEHLNRALTAIYILQSSLDFEQGGEIAGDLFQLYEFARFHVLSALRGEAEARLPEAAGAIAEIVAAWETIGSEVRAGRGGAA
ncbi:flagellar export chaperone FliS [Roseovarius aquimarinus]|uniref:Flagellar export chaperone FliS n=1 Tax=Roseovarius aquimarinus TaxID=1229156 RepID=A0ABW7I6D9_9RHOB